MKKSGRYLFCCVIAFTVAFHSLAQSLSSPESVVYDNAYSRYLISNTGSGTIVTRSMVTANSTFVSGLTGPKGMCIKGNRLYVTDSKRVKSFLLSNGALVMNLSISGAVDLNDITTDNLKFLYVSDLSGNKIFKINTFNSTYSILASTGLNKPNGLLYDGPNNRLILCSYRSNSPIEAVNLSTGAISTIVSTTLSNLDGLTRDDSANIYVSSWGTGKIYRFDSAFNTGPTGYGSGYNSPADIFYNTEAKVMAIPMMNISQLAYLNMLNPVIKINGSDTICPGAGVTLSTVSGSNLTYVWKRNGVAWSNNSTTLATQAGTYEVKVTNHLGSKTSASVHIYAYSQPAKPTISYAGSTSFCLGDSLVLHAPVGFTSYQWSNNDTTANKTIKSSGAYHLIVYDTNNCASPASDPVTVTVGPSIIKPSITLQGNSQFCHDDSAILSGPAGFHYHWSNGDTTQSIKITQSKSIFLYISDSAGCYSYHSDTVVVHVLPKPSKPIITTHGHTSFCHGDSVILSVLHGYFSYHWSDGDSLLIKTIKTSGHYSVKLTDSNGCISDWSDTVNVTLFPLPHKPTITTQNHTTICNGDSAILVAPAGYPHYYWYPTGHSQHLFVKYTGKYAVRVQDTNGCMSPSSDSIHVHVLPLPGIPQIGVYPDTILCEGDTAILHGPAGYDQYIWSDHDSGLYKPVWESKTLRLQVVDSNSCISPSSYPVNIHIIPKPHKPDIMRLHGDTLYSSETGDSYLWFFNGQQMSTYAPSIIAIHKGYYLLVIKSGHCYSDTSDKYYFIPESLNYPVNDNILIYPNPGKGQLWLKVPGNFIGLRYSIKDASGRFVKDGLIKRSETEITGLQSGIYFIFIMDRSRPYIAKLMIQ